MSMTLEEVDALLKSIDDKRSLASHNILELMADVTYTWIVGIGHPAPAALSGITKERVTPALKAFDEMWHVFGLLIKVLDQAKALRQSLPKFMYGQDLAKIEELLTGQSVKITVTVPFSQRDLLDPSEITNAMSPQRVLEVMVKAYQQARDVVIAIEAARFANSSKLTAFTDELTALEAEAKSLGEINLSEITLANQACEAVRVSLDTDPLGTIDDFVKVIEPKMLPIRSRIGMLRQERDQVLAQLAQSKELINKLSAIYAQAKAAYNERNLKIALDDNRTTLVLFDQTAIDDPQRGLAPWIARLEGLLSTGNWRNTGIGLSNWLSQANLRQREASAVLEENQTLLAFRRELRGRLDAYKAMVNQRGLAEDKGLAELFAEAHRLLHGRPTPIAQAEKLVNDYAAKIKSA